jgi:MFS-type transporter involved in bile tolerance (Atg22 family)
MVIATIGDFLDTKSAYERVFLGIAITVTIVWSVATLVQIAFPTRVVPEYANFIMMTVAGGFFGGAVLSSKRNVNSNGVFNKKDKHDDEDPYDGPGGFFRADR